jgi:PAS domain S-box-containing protein
MILPPGQEKHRTPPSGPAAVGAVHWTLQEDNEDWFRELVEHSQDVLAVHDLEGRILAVNPTAARLTGYAAADLLKIPLRTLIAPEFHAEFNGYLTTVRTAGEARGFMAVITRSGQRRIWEYRAALSRSGKKPSSVHCVAHDVTAMVQEHRALRASNEALRKRTREQQRLLHELQLFRTLLDHSNDAVQVIEPVTLRLLDVNQRTCLELGYTREELLQMTIFDISSGYNEKDREAVMEQIKAAGFATVERIRRRKDGTTFPVEVTIREAHLDRTYGVVVSRDISQRKQSEEALRQREADLNRAQSVAHIGSWRFDLLQQTVSFSNETYRIIGLPIGFPLTPETAQAKIHFYDLPQLLADWRQALASGTLDAESRIWRYGEVRWVRTRAQFEYDAQGTPVLAVGTVQDITESKQAAQLLATQEQRFHAMFDRSPIGIALTETATGRLLQVNARYCDIAGREAAELLSLDFQSITHPDDLARELELMRQFSSRQIAFFELEKRYLRPDGSIRWVKIMVVPAWSDEATPTTHLAMVKDITERKLAERALRLSEARERARSRELETVLETVPVAVFIARDSECLRVTGNSAAYAQLGAPPGSNLSRTASVSQRAEFRVIENGAEVPSDLLPIQQSAATGRPICNRPLTIVLPDGSRKETIANVVPLFDDEGRPRGAVAASIDVTELKRTEEALRHSEQRYRLLYEKTPLGVALVDAKSGRYLQLNPRSCEIMGRSREELLQSTSDGITHPEDVARNMAIRTGLAENPDRIREWEKRIVLPDGSVRWLRLLAAPLLDAGGSPASYISLAEDITELRRTQMDLRQSEERFRVALAGSPIKVFNQDRDLRYTWVYNLQEGWSEKDYLGRTDEEIFGPEAGAIMSAIKRPVLKTGQRTRQEFTLETHGKKYYCDITVEPLHDAHGAVIGVNCACIDVTHLHEIADELRLAKEKLSEEKLYLEQSIANELGFGEIVGRSAALQAVMDQVAKVAPSQATVLLLGETGTGKELVARAIHRMSRYPDQAFIKLNCAAIPSGLLESELFGHEKGAFTGAVARKIGRLELADGGTLFLDEIGEISLDLQPKLLRVLQDHEFERLGGTHTIQVDFRLVAATNRDLWQSVTQRQFRSDLYYRLHVFPIRTPPLRDRREDIPLLVEHFVKKTSALMGKSITTIPSKAMEALMQWPWPGNIRELENLVERSVILSPGSVLQVPLSEFAMQDLPDRVETLRESDREHILEALRACNGRLGGPSGAAARLGMKRTTLQSRLNQLGIRPADFRRSS